MSKKPGKYITAFNYIDKTSIVLSVLSGGISIVSFTSVFGVPAAIASASFSLLLQEWYNRIDIIIYKIIMYNI